jgi:type I restriction-modification system DNA methylase subunit
MTTDTASDLSYTDTLSKAAGALRGQVGSQIGFKGSRYKARDTLGRVNDYLLCEFAAAEGKLGGEFYTPRYVARVLVEMLEPLDCMRQRRTKRAV